MRALEDAKVRGEERPERSVFASGKWRKVELACMAVEMGAECCAEVVSAPWNCCCVCVGFGGAGSYCLRSLCASIEVACNN